MVELLLEARAKVDYKYIVYVSEPTPSLVYASVELIANPGVSGCYSM